MRKRRVRRSRDQVLAILAEFRDSGMSRSEFCQEKGYHSGTFSRWLRRYGKIEDSPGRSLIPVKLPEPTVPALVEIRLTNDRELRVPENIRAESLIRLVGALEGC